MKKIISMTLAIVLCLTLFTSTVLAEAGNKLEPGAGITFGHYEQDNDLANGAEPIEWVVLEVSGNKALLISHYGLDAKPYNTDYIDTTWETCSLRAWLNSDFLNTAFTAEEQTAILTSDVDNSDGQGFDFTTVYDYAEKVTGGNNTQDRIFLLSCNEAYRYYEVTFKNERNNESRVAPTAYAKQNGASTNTKKKTADGAKAGWWWLRSPGTVQSYASRISCDGSLSLDCVHNAVSCVRPVLWIDLEVPFF